MPWYLPGHFCQLFFLVNALLTSAPDNADIPPTKPPIKAVTINNNIQFGSFISVATLFASMLSLGMDLKSAIAAHTMNTAENPAKKDLAGVLPMNNAGKKAAIATIHQGRKYPPAKVNIRMMKNNI